MTKKYTEPQGGDFSDLDREIWINGEKLEIPEEESEDAEDDPKR